MGNNWYKSYIILKLHHYFLRFSGLEVHNLFNKIDAYLWNNIGTILGQFWDKFGAILRQFLDHFVKISGSFWDNFVIISWKFRNKFGIIYD